MSRGTKLVSFLVLAAALAALDCSAGQNIGAGGGGSGRGGDTPDTAPMAVLPFEAFTPRQAMSKVKYVLTGMPVTDAEVSAYAADGNSFSSALDGWMATPGFDAAMLTFFGNAFQQSQLTAIQTKEQDTASTGAPLPTVLELKQMYPRTALAIVKENADFREVVTGTRFQMPTTLMMYYAFMDSIHVDDKGRVNERMFGNQPSLVDYRGYPILDGNPNFTWTLQQDTPTDLNEVLDSSNPNGPNFMRFYGTGGYVPSAVSAAATPNAQLACAAIRNPRFGKSAGASTRCPSLKLYNMIAGLDAHNLYTYLCDKPTVDLLVDGVTVNCLGAKPPSSLLATDSTDWRWVSIRQPALGEKSTPFYDIHRLRAASELVLITPRVGFFTTPSFLAQWGTNVSNQHRVGMNQTLIATIGRAFDGVDQTEPTIADALDPVHAPKGSPCYGCHITMDPMRQFFRRTMTLSYHVQVDKKQFAILGDYARNGQNRTGSTLPDLAQFLLQDMNFAIAWSKKVCDWANSAPCDETDPELVRVAEVFAQSGYKFKTLLHEMMSSPLVTYLSSTQSTEKNGQVVSLSRRDQLCNVLSQRLSLTNPCGIDVAVPSQQTAANRLTTVVSSAYPVDLYSRGEHAPSPVSAPTLSSRMALESMCGLVSVDAVAKGGPISPSDPTAAIEVLAGRLMGTSGTVNEAAKAILQGHFAAVSAAGLKTQDAIRSTFVLACLSPYVASIGQ